jgi:adenosylcobinamide-GDP ribazoletransferase
MKILSFKRLQLAISFYTRLPIMVRDSTPTLNYNELPQAVIYLPVVGWIVGACSGLVFYLAVCIWSQVTAVVIALTAGIILTGALQRRFC